TMASILSPIPQGHPSQKLIQEPLQSWNPSSVGQTQSLTWNNRDRDYSGSSRGSVTPPSSSSFPSTHTSSTLAEMDCHGPRPSTSHRKSFPSNSSPTTLSNRPGPMDSGRAHNLYHGHFYDNDDHDNEIDSSDNDDDTKNIQGQGATISPTTVPIEPRRGDKAPKQDRFRFSRPSLLRKPQTLQVLSSHRWRRQVSDGHFEDDEDDHEEEEEVKCSHLPKEDSQRCQQDQEPIMTLGGAKQQGRRKSLVDVIWFGRSSQQANHAHNSGTNNNNNKTKTKDKNKRGSGLWGQQREQRHATAATLPVRISFPKPISAPVPVDAFASVPVKSDGKEKPREEDAEEEEEEATTTATTIASAAATAAAAEATNMTLWDKERADHIKGLGPGQMRMARPSSDDALVRRDPDNDPNQPRTKPKIYIERAWCRLKQLGPLSPPTSSTSLPLSESEGGSAAVNGSSWKRLTKRDSAAPGSLTISSPLLTTATASTAATTTTAVLSAAVSGAEPISPQVNTQQTLEKSPSRKDTFAERGTSTWRKLWPANRRSTHGYLKDSSSSSREVEIEVEASAPVVCDRPVHPLDELPSSSSSSSSSSRPQPLPGVIAPINYNGNESHMSVEQRRLSAVQSRWNDHYHGQHSHNTLASSSSNTSIGTQGTSPGGTPLSGANPALNERRRHTYDTYHSTPLRPTDEGTGTSTTKARPESSRFKTERHHSVPTMMVPEASQGPWASSSSPYYQHQNNSIGSSGSHVFAEVHETNKTWRGLFAAVRQLSHSTSTTGSSIHSNSSGSSSSVTLSSSLYSSDVDILCRQGLDEDEEEDEKPPLGGVAMDGSEQSGKYAKVGEEEEEAEVKTKREGVPSQKRPFKKSGGGRKKQDRTRKEKGRGGGKDKERRPMAVPGVPGVRRFSSIFQARDGAMRRSVISLW
ncbi:hypothetical protein BGW38_004813, partial [Lunasporangiospora selenospora]